MNRASKTVDVSKLNPQDIFLNRELTWLDFNFRVLFEAKRAENPLLERVKFLAIVNNNLDEFFMKRIGGLKQQVAMKITALSVDGKTAEQQIEECYQVVEKLEQEIDEIWLNLYEELKNNDIEITNFSALDENKQQEMKEFFAQNLYPILTPQAMDPAHPFPFVSNLSLNLLITLKYPNGKSSIARVKIPSGSDSPRFIDTDIVNKSGRQFILIEDLILNNLDLLFPQMIIEKADIFRATRNAVTEKNEEKAEDLLELIENELRERIVAPIVRLQCNSDILPVHKGMLAAELGLIEDKDTFESKTLLAKKDLFELASLDRAELKYKRFSPQENENFVNEDNIFHAIRKYGPFLIQHPYESFTGTVEKLLKSAARDPKVIGIKMTLYRTSSNSKIIDYLIEASRNGKQVSVVVEVKARFDESANIHWANHLEEAGIHITYGIVGLKTHTKLIYIIRNDYDGFRRYAHIGTGNYHSGTARQYTDFGLITSDKEIGSDLTELFNYLTTGYTPNREYKKLLPAPQIMKKTLLNKIMRETYNAASGKKAIIRFKCNALEDVDIVKALYLASQAGVKIELIIRDSCRLIAGVPKLSENIRVVSIVGRFLEHGRVYYFYNEGKEEYYIGSADLMHRNLESRVEVLTPVEDKKLQDYLSNYLFAQFNDCANAWEMNSDGTYTKRANPKNKLGVQELFIKEAKTRFKNAEQIQNRKTNSLT